MGNGHYWVAVPFSNMRQCAACGVLETPVATAETCRLGEPFRAGLAEGRRLGQQPQVGAHYCARIKWMRDALEYIAETPEGAHYLPTDDLQKVIDDLREAATKALAIDAGSAASGYHANIQSLLSLRERCELSQQEEALWAAELDRFWRQLSEEQQNSIGESLRDGKEPASDE